MRASNWDLVDGGHLGPRTRTPSCANINTPAGTVQYTSAAAEGSLNFEAVVYVKIQIHGEVQKQKGTTVGDGASPNINTPAGTVQYTSAATEGCLKF